MQANAQAQAAPRLRIAALATSSGREPGLVNAPTPAEPPAVGAAMATPALQKALEQRRAELLAAHPELVGQNSSVRDANPRSAVEWLLDGLREEAWPPGIAWADLQLVCLVHSTIDANVFHAPAARIKHELGARKALPYAVGQSQSLAFFHALALLTAWPQRPSDVSATALLACVEKRRAPLASHFSLRTPISDGVASAVVRFDAGAGLVLQALRLSPAVLADEAEAFHAVIDQGHAKHALHIAQTLWAMLADHPDALCAGPGGMGVLAQQVAQELSRLSSGRVKSMPASQQFFMATDPAMALQRATLANRSALPLLLWSVDDRLSLGAALFLGPLAQEAQ